MITTEIAKQQYEIYTLLAERRLKDAFGKLAVLITELQDWLSRDKLNEMEMSYKYMIQYMLDGVEDPERKRIYDHLVVSAYALTDRVSDELAAPVSPAQYYGWKRYVGWKRRPVSCLWTCGPTIRLVKRTTPRCAMPSIPTASPTTWWGC